MFHILDVICHNYLFSPEANNSYSFYDKIALYSIFPYLEKKSGEAYSMDKRSQRGALVNKVEN